VRRLALERVAKVASTVLRLPVDLGRVSRPEASVAVDPPSAVVMRRRGPRTAGAGALGFALAGFLATMAGWAPPANADVEVTRFDIDLREQLRFNRSDCAPDQTSAMFLELQVGSAPHNLRYVHYPRTGPLGACPVDRVEPLAVEVFAEETITPLGGEILITRNIDRAKLMGTGSCATDDAPEAAQRAEFFFCVQVFALPGDLTALGAAQVAVDVDTTLPPIPTVVDVRGGNESVIVTVEPIVSADGDATSFLVQSRACADDFVAEGEGEGEGEGEAEGSSTSSCGATGDWLETTGAAPEVEVAAATGSTIELRVMAVDDFGNRSDATETTLASPAANLSALALYGGAPNAMSCAPSNCSDADAAWLLGGMSLWRLRRRSSSSQAREHRRKKAGKTSRLFGLVCVVVGLGSASAAHAAGEFQGPAHRDLGRMTLSLGLSSYVPSIDRTSTFPVYECFFDDAVLGAVGGNADFHVFDGFGSLQLTTGLGFTQAKGFAQPPLAATTGRCEKATDTSVELTLALLRAGVTYRFDPLLDHFGVPLVPYGRMGLLGIGYLFSVDGVGDTQNPRQNPSGSRVGIEAAAGLMLALDFMDALDPFTPGATRRARAAGVFDHTFVYVEGAYQDVRSFGAPGFDFSPRDDFLDSGLPVSWTVGLAVELM
jgi:hypothetical protein